MLLMSINPEILRRISLLPKSVIAEVLSIFADFVADFEAQKTQSVAIIQQQNEPQKTQKTQNEAQNPSVKGGLGDIFLSSLSSKDREEVEEEGDEKQPLIGKPSTRMPRARGVSVAFDEFWNAFPKRINKKSAMQKYENAIKNGIDKSHILSAANRYATAMRSTEKQYVKAPDVWLNKGCYDDELPGAPNGHGQPNQNIPPLVFVKRDTPQWDAWRVYHTKEHGREPPSDRNGGWYFPSEYPPGTHAGCEKISGARDDP
ncbi:hypothetical protein L0337_20645 [candidate division KSB1 bacterium]|nr:hypothetical protein [candidate division KSB1 bacterium]